MLPRKLDRNWTDRQISLQLQPSALVFPQEASGDEFTEQRDDQDDKDNELEKS
jgi:hypothetical protein